MTHNQAPNLASLFLAALEVPPEQRESFLSETCSNNPGLREEVDRLLQVQDEAEGFLSAPPHAIVETLIGDKVGTDPSRMSVLSGMCRLSELPSVSLDDSIDEGLDPVVRPSSAELPPQRTDGRYQLQGEIARGGMGAVLKGRDIDLGRSVAIKVLLDAHKERPEVVQRFVEEAQIGGQLQHPGIAPVYELGQFSDSRPFFCMKLVRGETLSALLNRRKRIGEDRARFIGIFEQVCQTMAYAHSRGVIHRDLKPANVMVGTFGEVQVMDWGLAKVLQSGGIADEKKARDAQQQHSVIATLRTPQFDEDGHVASIGSDTQMGSVMGTPAYMPPEQALGEVDRLDKPVDVFGLGAMLCEILTGSPPYVAERGVDVYRMATRGKLGDCHQRLDDCGADDELVQLAKDCLTIEPADRPATAGDVAVRVTQYLESAEARLREAEKKQAAEAARAVEERKRRRVALALAASLLLLVTGASGTAVWLNHERTQRQMRATGSVNAALGDAKLHRGLAETDNLAARVAELDLAIVSAQQAVEFARQPEVNTFTRDEADGLLALVESEADEARETAERARVESALEKRLDEIRLSDADSPVENVMAPHRDRDFDYEATHKRYLSAFEEAGFDFTHDGHAAIAARVRASDVRESLINALDHWTRVLDRQQRPAQLRDYIVVADWDNSLRVARYMQGIQPDSSSFRLVTAQQLAAGDDREAYREHCQQFLDEFAAKDLYRVDLRVCKACLLRPGVFDPHDLPTESWFEFMEQPDVPAELESLLPMCWGIRSLVNLRKGNFEEALDNIEKADLASPDHFMRSFTLSIKAVAEARLGRYEDAKQSLQDTVKPLLEWKSDTAYGLGDVPVVLGFCQEAEAILGDDAPAESVLDQYLATDHVQFLPTAFRERLLALVTAVDAQDLRKSLRTALARGDMTIVEETVSENDLTAQSPELLAWLGASLRSADKDELSVDVLQAAQQSHPGDFWINYELSKSLTDVGQPELATGYARAAMAVRPQGFGAHWNLINTLLAADQTAEAEQRWQRLLTRDDLTAGTCDGLAYVLEADHPEMALQAFRKAVELNPENASSWASRAHLAFDLHDLDEAIESQQKLIKLVPDEAGAHYNLGFFLRKAGREDEAIEPLKTAFELDPSHMPSFVTLRSLLTQQGRIEERDALQDRFKARKSVSPQDRLAIAQNRVTESPHLSSAHVLLGRALQAVQDNEQAMASFRKALKLDPQNVSASVHLADILRRRQDYEAAETLIEQAIAVRPQRGLLHEAHGDILKDQEKWGEAIAAYRKALELMPRHPSIKEALAEALRGAGRDTEAEQLMTERQSQIPRRSSPPTSTEPPTAKQLEDRIALLRESIAKAPDHFMLHVMLSGMLIDAEQLDEAEKVIERARELDPENPRPYGLLGEVRVQQERLDEALTAYEQAKEVAPDPTFAERKIASVWIQQGEFDKAISFFQSEMANGSKNAQGFNVIAWNLLTTPEESGEYAHVEESLTFATRAVELRKVSGTPVNLASAQNTLGLAYYRNGQYEEAIKACEQSNASGRARTAANWVVLALAHAKLGQADVAKECAARAMEWTKDNDIPTGQQGLFAEMKAMIAND